MMCVFVQLKVYEVPKFSFFFFFFFLLFFDFDLDFDFDFDKPWRRHNVNGTARPIQHRTTDGFG